MLVLSRKIKEEVVLVIPPSSEPTVIKLSAVRLLKASVRLGVEAPRQVAIHRREIIAKDPEILTDLGVEPVAV